VHQVFKGTGFFSVDLFREEEQLLSNTSDASGPLPGMQERTFDPAISALFFALLREHKGEFTMGTCGL
jgi:hypothetical protein